MFPKQAKRKPENNVICFLSESQTNKNAVGDRAIFPLPSFSKPVAEAGDDAGPACGLHQSINDL